jgi:hypothetical protein
MTFVGGGQSSSKGIVFYNKGVVYSFGVEMVRVCDPAKIFFTIKFGYLLFWNPPIKLKEGQHIGRELLIANHLDQSV